MINSDINIKLNAYEAIPPLKKTLQSQKQLGKSVVTKFNAYGTKPGFYGPEKRQSQILKTTYNAIIINHQIRLSPGFNPW
jgi:hypothetical protein